MLAKNQKPYKKGIPDMKKRQMEILKLNNAATKSNNLSGG
jgi:hypothetical protein